MRIVLVNGTAHWGGGERWFSDAASALAGFGHDLLLVAEPGTPVYLRFASLSGSGRTRVCPIGDLSDELRTGAHEVALCNSGRELRLALRAAGRRSQLRFVLRRGLDRPLRDNLFRRRVWRRLSAIVVNSDATDRTVRRSLPWFPTDRIRRIYNPVSFEAAARVPPDNGTLRLGAVGRHVKQKGLPVLFQAMACIGDELKWTLAIAGDGKLRSSLERLAERHGIADRCRFLGRVDALAPLYARLDAVVIPSLYEGFCFVAGEAALASLPVIASNVSSLPEVVTDSVTGLLVPPQDPDALASAVRRVSQDPNGARALGEAARASVSERFAPAPLHRELDELLLAVRDLPAVGAS